MPGIAGIIRFDSPEQCEQETRLMVEAMRYEPHYRTGQHNCPELGLHVGWVVPRGAYADCMPLVSERDGVVLVFQGEHFGHDEVKAGQANELTARAVLALYDKWGDEFLTHLNGWFCGVIVDRRRRKVTLFNDRYGMGRVYVHEGRDEVVFASEAKALLKVRPALRAIQPDALAEQFRYNCVLNNRSLFKGVALLPHASAWEFSGSSVPQRNRFFDFGEWERQPVLGEAEFYAKFLETVARVFPAYGQATEKVAFSLTAGLDTRAIMAALGEAGNRGMPCYTYGGPWRELYDIRTARKLTEIYGQPFSTIKVGEEFLQNFGSYARRAVHASDGTHDAFGAHDVYFNEVARKTALIRLTGKFGSEVVRIRHIVPSMTYPTGLLADGFGGLVSRLPRFSEVNATLHPVTRVVTQEVPWHEYARVAVEQSQTVLRSPYMDNALVKLMYQAPPGIRAAGDLQERFVKDYCPVLATVPTNLGRFAGRHPLWNKLYYGPLWALFKVEYIYLYATPHWMTRVDRSLAGLHLERWFAGRQKWEGYRIWAKTHFAGFVRDTLLNPTAGYSAYMNRREVERMVERHLAGTHNYQKEINRALTLELLCDTLLKP